MNDDEGHHDRQLQLMLENDPKTVQLRHPSLYNAYYSEKEDGGLTLKSDADSEMTPLAPRPRIQPDLLLPNVLLIGAEKAGSTSVSSAYNDIVSPPEYI